MRDKIGGFGQSAVLHTLSHILMLSDPKGKQQKLRSCLARQFV